MRQASKRVPDSAEKTVRRIWALLRNRCFRPSEALRCEFNGAFVGRPPTGRKT
jgi:hypothetical protein